MNDPLRVFIVDDEAPARARLAALLSDIAGELPSQVVGAAENGVQALEGLAQAEADVVLLDIRMPRMDGIELAQHLQRLPRPPAVVFVTAYDQYAVRAFELSATDYLLKPVRAQRLQAALAKARPSAPPPQLARELAPRGRRFLSCGERGRVLLVPVDEILYLRAEQKYLTCRTAQREFLLEESLVQLEQEFGERFVRVHRNCLVARDAIAGFERAQDEDGEARWSVLLRGVPETLAVSRRQWPQVKSAIEPGRRD